MLSSVLKMSCLILVVAASAQEYLETREQKEELKHFCGRALAHMRSYVCMGMEREAQTNSASVVRRSSPNSIEPKMFTNTPDKKISGIVDECCIKPCRISDILSYC